MDKEATAGAAAARAEAPDPLLARPPDPRTPRDIPTPCFSPRRAPPTPPRLPAHPRNLLSARPSGGPSPPIPPDTQVEDLFVPTAAVRPILAAVGAEEEFYTAQQCVDLVQAYVKQMVRVAEMVGRRKVAGERLAEGAPEALRDVRPALRNAAANAGPGAAGEPPEPGAARRDAVRRAGEGDAQARGAVSHGGGAGARVCGWERVPRGFLHPGRREPRGPR